MTLAKAFLKRFKLSSSLMLGGFTFLFLSGAFNLFYTYHKMNRTMLDAMILGNPAGAPLFYLKQFVFPDNIEIPLGSTHTDRYIESVSLFPSLFEVIKSSSKTINGNDSVVIQYQGNQDRNIFKCDGTPLNPSETTQSLYYVSPSGDLNCAEIINNQPNFKNTKAIVKNVDAFRVSYGMDPNKDNVTDFYTPASANNFIFENLSSIKISLLIRTFEKDKSQAGQQIYTLGDSTIGPYADGYFRKPLTMILPIKRNAQ